MVDKSTWLTEEALLLSDTRGVITGMLQDTVRRNIDGEADILLGVVS